MRNKFCLIGLLLPLGLIILCSACHKRVPAAAPAAPGPPTCNLTAEPATVTAGQSVTLSWNSQNATGLELKPGLGQQQAEGSTSVTPSESTTYTLSLTGAGGTSECSARVTVTPAVPPAH